MKTRQVIDVYGQTLNVADNQPVVCCTDKWLSGWGQAVGKIHKQVIICDSWEQADLVERNLAKCGYTYINSRRGLPRYSSSRYSVSFRDVKDCPLWTK